MPFDKGPLLPIPKLRAESRERREQHAGEQPRDGRGFRNPLHNAGKRNRRQVHNAVTMAIRRTATTASPRYRANG